MKNIPLSTLQQWMQAVIEHPGTTDEAVRSAGASEHLPPEAALDAVVGSGALSPTDRIGIYRRMFFLRMTESMAIDYPGVKAFLGEERFDQLIVDEYVRQHPSGSYTLNHLGRYFPQFLRSSSLPEHEMLADLATMELTVTNALDAEEMPLLSAERIAAIPPDGWDAIRFIPVKAAALLTLGHPVHMLLDAATEETDLPIIAPRSTHLLVYRKAFRTFWEEQTPQQYHLLALLLSGTRFGDALTMLAGSHPEGGTELQENLFRWFADWVGKGLFSDIQ